MKETPRVGLDYRRQFEVETRHLIMFADDLMPAVLSTPQLIGELERTAREAIDPFLESFERTVGSEIEVRHSAATFLGAIVTCQARVLRVESREIVFAVEARDQWDVLCRGSHRRRVIDARRFRARLAKKQERGLALDQRASQ